MQITPDTKVAELLDRFPQLETAMLKLSPSFAALKNPVLRKTVAKVTSLQQAAKVGGINVVEMVTILRKEAGLSPPDEHFRSVQSEKSVPFSEKTDSPNIVYRLDVRPAIEAGENPKEAVIKEAEKLLPGEMMELLSPFPPIPLIELLQKRGFRITAPESANGTILTLIEKPAP